MGEIDKKAVGPHPLEGIPEGGQDRAVEVDLRLVEDRIS
jgi:hypothetical protein